MQRCGVIQQVSGLIAMLLASLASSAHIRQFADPFKALFCTVVIGRLRTLIDRFHCTYIVQMCVVHSYSIVSTPHPDPLSSVAILPLCPPTHHPDFTWVYVGWVAINL